MALLFTIFKTDTPIYYNKKGDYKNMRIILSKIYKPSVLQQKSDEIQGNTGKNGQNAIATYKDVLCHPKYRRATYVGLALTIF